MFEALKRFLTTDSLSPHGICLTWRPELIWVHVVSDAIIGLAYFSIPVALAVFVSRRRDLVFSWVFWFFAAFILACGTTHFMSIWTLWVPDYGLEGLIKATTAALSFATAIALWPLLPKALALPSPAQLRRANQELTARIAERDAALQALAKETADRQKAEEMLRQSQKMEAIGQFTGGVAHDFNNLLGVISGNLERIERHAPQTDLTKRATRDALDAASRAAAIVRKLMAFARKQPLIATEADVNKLVQDMAPLLTGALVHGRIEMNLSASWLVRIDTNQFENALLNLAVNARDAMTDGGTLTISSRNAEIETDTVPGLAAGSYVAIEVRDTGSGMTPSVCERAFEPFFTTKSFGRGTGLGLSQVFGFVSQSGGTVRLVSDVGKGTCVTLWLPKAVIQPVPAQRPCDLPVPSFSGSTLQTG
jgi:signal transduction histidine kinase